MRTLAFRTFFLSLAAALVASCGGGGGADTGADSIAVTIRAGMVSITTDNLAYTSITAALSTVPTGPVYAYVTADQPVFEEGIATAQRNGDGSYTVMLQTRKGLASGAYNGNLSLWLCKDVHCVSKYSLTGNTLPYQINIVPPLARPTITVNGVAVVVPASVWGLPVHRGDKLMLSSSQAVTWTQSGDAATVLSNLVTSTTTWSATVSGSSGLIAVTAHVPGSAADVSFLIY